MSTAAAAECNRKDMAPSHTQIHAQLNYLACKKQYVRSCTCVNYCKATKQRTDTLQSQSSCSFIPLILLVWQGAKLQILSQADPAALVHNMALLTFHNTI